MKVRIGEFNVAFNFGDLSTQLVHLSIRLCFEMFDLSTEGMGLGAMRNLYRLALKTIPGLFVINSARVKEVHSLGAGQLRLSRNASS